MKKPEETAAALGYRMPAEWEPHEATWISWPRRAGISFPDAYDSVLPIFSKMIDALADSEKVCINVADQAVESEVLAALEAHRARTDHLQFHHIPTNEPWCRDHGPIFLRHRKDATLAVVDWEYNAWGWKYPPFDLDNEVAATVAERLGLPCFSAGMVLEGGSIDVNGKGALLTTASCLLNPNRNPDLSKHEIEQKLRDFLGVRRIIWLGEGIEGDDTDGHIDDIARFVAPNRVVAVFEEDEQDENHLPLRRNFDQLITETLEDERPLEVAKLPMPAPIIRDGQRLPASYANFYIGNRVVLLPVFADACDKWAETVLQNAFPTRRIVPIDCRDLIWGLGAFHCLTQQQPAAG
jgi:agmatine deiminase